MSTYIHTSQQNYSIDRYFNNDKDYLIGQLKVETEQLEENL